MAKEMMIKEMTQKAMKEFTFYGHRNTELGVTKWIKASMEAKAPLEAIFSKCEGYDGNGRIVRDYTFTREVDPYVLKDCVNQFLQKVNAEKKVLVRQDENGNTLEMAVNNAFAGVTISSITDLENLSQVSLNGVENFRNDGIYRPSFEKWGNLKRCMQYLNSYTEANIDEECAEFLNYKFPSIKAKPGMKTSRAFRAVFVACGIADDKDFNKAFPQYADLVNAKDVEQKVVISIHPMDYMRNSFGNTWSSCHTMDGNNRRETRMTRSNTDNYRGMHCNGNMSYSLDDVTFSVYVIDKQKFDDNTGDIFALEREDYESKFETGRIYRCLFHYKDGVLIQGRVYPQCFDGTMDLEKKFRHIAQSVIAEGLGIEFVNNGSSNDTWKRLGKSAYNNRSYRDANGNVIEWNNVGTHYPDVNHEYSSTEKSGPNVSLLKGYDNGNTSGVNIMTIGHTPLCLVCGKEDDDVNHYSFCCDYTTGCNRRYEEWLRVGDSEIAEVVISETDDLPF